jgi:pyridoxine 5-phosphate synthase
MGTARLQRLGVNIDHVATLRNARGAPYPDPVRAARMAREAGADIITMHLREDRRHIRDVDVEAVTRESDIPVNLEMAATEEMVAIALRLKPYACCIVPERREEVTTEGGLDAAGQHNHLAPIVAKLNDAGIRVSLFIAPDQKQIAATQKLRAPDIELHTGAYCDAVLAGESEAAQRLLEDLRRGAAFGASLGLEVHAGHGLTYDNVAPIASIPEIVELQIGHFLVGESVFVGFAPAIRRMRDIMDRARIGA